jgi:hypothetical protein
LNHGPFDDGTDTRHGAYFVCLLGDVHAVDAVEVRSLVTTSPPYCTVRLKATQEAKLDAVLAAYVSSTLSIPAKACHGRLNEPLDKGKVWPTAAKRKGAL